MVSKVFIKKSALQGLKRNVRPQSFLIYFITGFPATLKNLKMSFKFFSRGKVGEFDKMLQIREESWNFIMVDCQKKVVVTSFCCLFHNQMTYLLNNNDWLWWLFGLEITPFLSLAWWL